MTHAILYNIRFTTLSDRGSAIIKAIQDNLSETFQFCCGLHLEGNLKEKKLSKAIQFFRQARNAKTKSNYEAVMEELKNSHLDAYIYLKNMEVNWQLYKAIERNQPVHAQNNDNLVEQVFAWTLEDRFHSPYYFIKGIK
jgi:hypothetical protein